MSNLTQLPGWLGRAGLVMLAFVATSCGDDNPSDPPTPGAIQASATTTGDELDPDGYTVTVDGGPGQALSANGSVTFTNQSAGSHEVELSGVAANCTVAGDNPRSVSVTAGNTATTAFTVTCSATVGGMEVTTVSTGDDIDPDGYTVSVDGGAAQAIGVNGTLTLSGLAPGDHSVELGGVAGNCTVAPDNPRTVAVTAGGTATTQFDVSCSALTGSLKIVNVTTGNNLDDAYTVSVDGGPGQALAANDSLVIASLAVGDHLVALEDVAGNCTVTPESPPTVTVASGSETRTQFDVSCTGGSLEITTSTWGTGLDADGFEVVIDGGTPQPIAVNETATFPLSVGDHSVQLQNVAVHCSLQSGTNPRTETVNEGAVTSTQYDVFCFETLTNHIVFTSQRDGDLEIYAKEIGGTAVDRLTNNSTVDATPAVSPDGSAVAFQSDRSGNPEIWKMSAIGFEQLTAFGSSDTEPSWAGDNSFIAYNRGGQIWTMTTSGGNHAALSSGADDGEPAVSPDGAWVLFRSRRDGNANVYVVNVSSGVETQLTTDAGVDAKPAWWFDGSRILWVSDRDSGDKLDIYVADFDPNTVTISAVDRLTSDPASDWMPNMRSNGSSIAFSSDRSGTFDIWTMDPDGSNQQKFEGSDSAADQYPSWSP